MERGDGYNSTPTKPPKSSSMTHEESKDLDNKVSKLFAKPT